LARADGGAGAIEIPSALIRIVESVDVAAADAGVLDQVCVREGQLVKQGELVAQVDDARLALLAEQAATEAEIAGQTAASDVALRLSQRAHQLAVKNLERAEAVNERVPNSVSRQEIDGLRLTAESTALEIEQADLQQAIARLSSQLKRTQLAVARHDVRRRSITAPLDGMIVHVGKRAGEWVEPGDLLARIVRVDRLRAEGFVSAEDAAGDLGDCPATLHVQLSDRTPVAIPGRVVFVSPEADPVNQQVRVWAEFDNRDAGIRPGLRGRLVIHRPAGSASPGPDGKTIAPGVGQ
jgi:multidrug efflux pump subunit AcrA (membrane-fusion protein)